MTSTWHDEVRDACRRENARRSRLERTRELLAGLKRDVNCGGPAILSHLTCYDLIACLERLEKLDLLVLEANA